jgi:ubiquinone/menaquinone biosynthesis C-methylase UbiE
MPGSAGDIWSQWLLQRRFGSDEQGKQAVREFLKNSRERVLQNTHLQPHDVLLDVGTGDGLVALGALKAQPSCLAILSDVSEEVLQRAKKNAQDLHLLNRCKFLQASADDLSPVGNDSVNVVTARSVLIYVDDKKQAFEEFYRVLKPGGRFSIFEPINSFAHPEPPHLFSGCDVTPVLDLARKVKAVYQRWQPESDPMLNFNERNLIRFAEQAGFPEVHLDLRIDIKPQIRPESWESFTRRAPNPKAPTLEEAIKEALSADEAMRFTTHLRPLVEHGRAVMRTALAYVWGNR